MELDDIRAMMKKHVIASGASACSISRVAGNDRNVLSNFISGRASIKLTTLLDMLNVLELEITIQKRESV